MEILIIYKLEDPYWKYRLKDLLKYSIIASVIRVKRAEMVIEVLLQQKAAFILRMESITIQKNFFQFLVKQENLVRDFNQIVQELNKE